MSGNEQMQAARFGTAACLRDFGLAIRNCQDGAASADLHSLISVSELEDEMGRLRLWAGNIGALQKGHSSLDYRLRDSNHAYDQVLNLLKELHQELEQISSILAGIRLPYDQMSARDYDDESSASESASSQSSSSIAGEEVAKTELEHRYLSVVDIIDNLFKISRMLRKPSANSRFLKAEFYREVDTDTNCDLIQQFSSFDRLYVEDLFQQCRREDGNLPVQDKPSEELDEIFISRLARAITRRRQCFLYWRRHRDKLGAAPNLEDFANMATQGPQKQNEKTSIPMVSSKAVPIDNLLNSALGSTTGKTILTGTTATAFIPIDEVSQAGRTTSFFGSVFHEAGHERIELPPPPTSAIPGRDFECPYCFVVCSGKEQSERAWRSHLFRDLRPYVCTYYKCDNSDSLFATRKEWLEHEISHRKYWRCIEHPDIEFLESSKFEEHIESLHLEVYEQTTLASLVTLSEVSAPDDRYLCQICFRMSSTEDEMHKHMANHLERLAAFALPRNREIEGSHASSDLDISKRRNAMSNSSEIVVQPPFKVPFSREESLLFGRENEIRRLNSIVSELNNEALKTILLQGEAHSGKTQIAKNFAWRCKDNGSFPGGIFWASLYGNSWSLDRMHTVLEDLFDLRKDGNTQERLGAIRDWFRNHRAWLLVFDNIVSKEVSSFIEHFYPSDCHEDGSIIITSRETSHFSMTTFWIMDIGPLAESDAKQFLFQQIGLADPTDDDNKDASFVVRSMQYKAHIIKSLGAKLRVTEEPLSEFARSISGDQNQFATWQLEEMKGIVVKESKYRKGPLNFMNIACFFSQEIPREIIHSGIGRDPKGQIDTQFAGYGDLFTMTNIVKLVPAFQMPLVMVQPDGQGSKRQQLVSVRRAGKQSSLGTCTRCLQMKIKCDSTIPSCMACERAGADCLIFDKAENKPISRQENFWNQVLSAKIEDITDQLEIQLLNTRTELALKMKPRNTRFYYNTPFLDGISNLEPFYTSDTFRFPRVVQDFWKESFPDVQTKKFWLKTAIEIFCLSHTYWTAALSKVGYMDSRRNCQQFRIHGRALLSNVKLLEHQGQFLTEETKSALDAVLLQVKWTDADEMSYLEELLRRKMERTSHEPLVPDAANRETSDELTLNSNQTALNDAHNATVAQSGKPFKLTVLSQEEMASLVLGGVSSSGEDSALADWIKSAADQEVRTTIQDEKSRGLAGRSDSDSKAGEEFNHAVQQSIKHGMKDAGDLITSQLQTDYPVNENGSNAEDDAKDANKTVTQAPSRKASTEFSNNNVLRSSAEEHMPEEPDSITLKIHDRFFSIPVNEYQRWTGMAEVIQRLSHQFYGDSIQSHIKEGKYVLVGPNAQIILPSDWESLVKPGWAITLIMPTL